MPDPLFHIDDGHRLIGTTLGVSEWITLEQRHVDLFSDATRDQAWAHIDPERSRQETPYGGTIVQGFLMLSSLIHLHHEMGLVAEGRDFALNYGLDRVRFTDVVPTGSRVRVTVDLLRYEPRGAGILMATKDVMEVEGKQRPCMVAEFLIWMVRRREDLK